MNLAILTSKVQSSHLLSSAERTYWLASMPRMTEPQLQKLEGILTKAEAIPWGEKAQRYLSIITKATAALAG